MFGAQQCSTVVHPLLVKPTLFLPQRGDFPPPTGRACCVQYVLRVVYRERTQEMSGSVGATPSVMPEPTRARGSKGIRGGTSRATAVPKGGDQGATDLLALVTAAKGLLQRTRVLSKRLNSLCAIHPQLMWELEEARRLRPEAKVDARIGEELLEFPDPFELGTLEVMRTGGRTYIDDLAVSRLELYVSLRFVICQLPFVFHATTVHGVGLC